jgi:hypothetical protein
MHTLMRLVEAIWIGEGGVLELHGLLTMNAHAAKL